MIYFVFVELNAYGFFFPFDFQRENDKKVPKTKSQRYAQTPSSTSAEEIINVIRLAEQVTILRIKLPFATFSPSIQQIIAA